MRTTRQATYNHTYHLMWLPTSRRTGDSADIAEQGSAQYRVAVLTGEVAHSPALLANWFTGISSRKYNHRHADHDRETIRWACGYYAGTAGHVSSETVGNYIDRHKEAEA